MQKITKKNGSPDWTRTSDSLINSQVLYRLSYRGMSFLTNESIANYLYFVKCFFRKYEEIENELSKLRVNYDISKITLQNALTTILRLFN